MKGKQCFYTTFNSPGQQKTGAVQGPKGSDNTKREPWAEPIPGNNGGTQIDWAIFPEENEGMQIDWAIFLGKHEGTQIGWAIFLGKTRVHS